MNIIAHTDHNSELLSTKISTFIKEFSVGAILKDCNAYKVRGFSIKDVFPVAIENVFCHKSFYQREKTKTSSIPFAKDTFYRFMNSYSINWRKFTLSLGATIINKAISYLTDDDRRNVLIVDDSLFSRSRSKKVELLARVYDHVKHEYTQGFRLLTLGWSDGNSFLPLNHCLLSSAERRNRLQESSSLVDARSNGGKQRKLAQNKAPEVVLTLLKEAKSMKISARHVLFDTWFCSPSSLQNIREIGYDVIAMVKKSETIHFRYQGRMQSPLTIYRKEKKRSGRSKYLLSVMAEVVRDGKSFPVKLVFVRNRNNRSDYLILVSTDITLSEEEIIQTYGKRWGIEVFFKTCKSYLKLGKECRSLSYDAMTAHVAIVFTRYMILSLEQRRNIDKRSLGELFYLAYEEMEDLRYFDALILVMKELVDFVKKKMTVFENELNELMEIFFEELPTLWKRSLKQCAS